MYITLHTISVSRKILSVFVNIHTKKYKVYSTCETVHINKCFRGSKQIEVYVQQKIICKNNQYILN